VLVQELGDDVGPEREGGAAVVLAPPGQVTLGVRPELEPILPFLKYFRQKMVEK
jgi:hypothetical protein